MEKRKIGFATKLLSNRMYLNEVSVEGKTSHKFNFKIGYYDLYSAQIIRNGNCITLLSNSIPITKDTFWNTNYFEDLTRYVFWTFNKSFLLKLIDTIDTLIPTTLQRCADLLRQNTEMIGKISMGRSFRGCISYCLEDKKQEYSQEIVFKNRAELIVFNQCFGDKKELTEQFRDVRLLNQKVQKPVLHVTLSLAPEDKLEKSKLMEMARECVKEMGFENNQYIAVSHIDTGQQPKTVVGKKGFRYFQISLLNFINLFLKALLF